MNMCFIGTAFERKRKSDGDSRGSTLKRMFRNSIVRCGRIFTAAEKKQNQLRHATKWVASCNIPLCMVERKEFREMIQSYAPTADPITKRALKLDLKSLEEKIREFQLSEMEGANVCTTLDHWTPQKGHDNYVGMNASWISEQWVMQSRTLGMFLHQGRSTAECIIDRFVSDISTKIGATADVFATTSDTTGSMNLFGLMLEEQGIHHPYCSDHVFHLTCKKLCNDETFEEGGLLNINSPSACVKMARKLVMFFNKSTQAMAKLKLAQQLLSSGHNNNNSDSSVVSVSLLQDVVTRWWSTHRMIKRLLELKDSVVFCFSGVGPCNINEDKKEACEWELTELQWKTLGHVVKVLEPFENGMRLLEGEKYVTASWVPFIVEMIRKGILHGTESEDGTVKRLSKILLKDFNNRWCVACMCACVLIMMLTALF